MDNPLIANCPEDPALAAAYWRGARWMLQAVATHRYVEQQFTAEHPCRVLLVSVTRQHDELQDHVLRMMPGRETPK